MTPSNLSLSSKVQRDKDIVSSTINDEVVMLSIEQGKYFGLDSVGSRIWDLLGEPVPIAEVVDTMIKQYNVDRQTCEEDIFELLVDMVENKIVKVVE